MCSNIVYKILLSCLFLTFPGGKGVAQNTQPDRGLPYFKTFLDEDHGGRQQSYDIEFDKRGITYVGNSKGVLEYDGSRWNNISINDTRHIYALDYNNKQDRIYLGGYTEIGYFDANPRRKKEYKSLLPLINPEEREFTKIEDSRSNGAYTFFLASERVFVFDGNAIQSFDPQSFVANISEKGDGEPYFKSLFFIDNTPYVIHSSVGLLKWTTSGFKPVNDGSFFERITNILFIKPYQKNHFLLGTNNGNLYTFNKALKSLIPFKTEANDYIKENQLTNAVVLNDGSIGLTTLTGGFVIVDEQGEWIQLLNKKANLPANYVIAAEQSPKGAIWLAMNSGITRIEWPPVISIIDNRLANFEDVFSLSRLDEELYLGTQSGLYKKTSSTIETLRNSTLTRTESFEKMSDSTYAVTYLQTIDDQLGIASGKGLFLYDPDTNSKKTVLSPPTLALVPAANNSNLFHGLFPDGYTQLRYNKSNRALERNGSTYSFGELLHEMVIGNSEIWYITGQTIFRQDLENTEIANSFTKLNRNIGLPNEGQYGGALFDGRFTVGTTKGAYRYIESQQRFVPDSVVNQLIGKNNIFYGYRRIDKNSFWIGYENDDDNSIARITKNTQGKYISQFAPFNRITQTVDSFTYTDPLDSTITWIGAVEGLIKYDHRLNSQKNYDAGNAIIREIRTIQSDSLMLSNVSSRSNIAEFPSHRRSMRFLFALPGNDAQQLTTFRYFLEGFDTEWSTWTSLTQKDYTNIPAGEYTFNVEAKNAYGNKSRVASFRFEIATPWYQSTIAYLLYVIFGIGGLAYAALWYSNYRTEQQAIRMRAEQAEELAKLDRIKTNLLTNISHELRTPLTLVLGPIEQLRKKASKLGQQWKRRLDIAHRNGNRLQQLVEQVLDLTRLDAKQLKLQPKNIELTSFLRRTAESFESMGERKKITIEADLPENSVELQADPDKLEKIMVNLLSNAIKFTPSGGFITLSTKDNSQNVQVTVADTGRGINPERLPHIFDRFNSTRERIAGGGKGLGVGLAITKEFVELHQGSIDVESEEGIGTTFTIMLPKKHYDDATKAEIEPIEYTPEDSTKPPINVASTNGSLKILVAEDNDDMRQFIAELLMEPNIRIETVENGLEAKKQLIITKPDLIISDIMMPEMDGFELAGYVRSVPEFWFTPIIMLSARAEAEDRIRGYEIGISDYLVKPFNEQELKARVQNLLTLKKKRDQQLEESAITKTKSSQKTSFVQNLQEFVIANLEKGEITVEELCDELNISRRQMYRKLKSSTGFTPAEFVREIRLNRARIILEKKQKQTVAEVSYAIGFSNARHFSQLFKSRFGRLPSDYLN